MTELRDDVPAMADPVGDYDVFGVPLGRDLLSANEPALGQPADKIDARAIESALAAFLFAIGNKVPTRRQLAVARGLWLKLLGVSHVGR